MRWALVVSNAPEDLMVAARKAGVFVAVQEQSVALFSENDAVWTTLGLGDVTTIQSASQLDSAGKRLLIDALEDHFASRVGVRIGWGCFATSHGQWQFDALIAGDTELIYGWSWAPCAWQSMSPAQLLDAETGGGLRCLVGGLARFGRCLGIAECSPELARAEQNVWKARVRTTLTMASNGSCFVAKVMLDNAQLLLVPPQILFCRRLNNCHSRADATALVFRNQNRAVAPISLKRSDGNALASLASLESEIDESGGQLLGGDSDDDLLVLPSQITSNASIVDLENNDENVVWEEICSRRLRLENQTNVRQLAQLRGSLLGLYEPLGGLPVARGGKYLVEEEWKPSRDFNNLKTDAFESKSMVESPLKSSPELSNMNGQKRLRCSFMEPEELMEMDPPERFVTQLLNQWFWPASRRLLWSENHCNDSDNIPTELLSLGEPLAAVSEWRSVAECQIRAKWEADQIVDFDASALFMWDRIRLGPVFPGKDVSYIAFTGEGQQSGTSLFLGNVASVWQSHALGQHRHVEENANDSVIEVSKDVVATQGVGEAYLDAICSYLDGRLAKVGQVAAAASAPLVLYLVWPMHASANALEILLCELNYDNVVVQTIPEHFLISASLWSLSTVAQLCMSTFGLIHMYEGMGITHEPAYLLSHPLFPSSSDPRMLHVAFFMDRNETYLAIAITDPAGEVWASSVRELSKHLPIAIILEQFLESNVPRIANIEWHVALLNCGSSVELDAMRFCGNRIKYAFLASVRRNVIFPIMSVEETSGKSIAMVDKETFLLRSASDVLLVHQCPAPVAEQLLVMMGMRNARLPQHVQFVLDESDRRAKL